MPEQSKVEPDTDSQLRAGLNGDAVNGREVGTEVGTEEAEALPRHRTRFGANPRSRPMLIVVLIVAVAAGLYVWHYYSKRETTDDAQIDGHIVPISARVSGAVVAVNVHDNQYVQRGTVIAQLDPKDYQVALDHARSDLADKQAAALAAGAGVPITSTTTTSDISTAQAGLNAARKEVDAARARRREAEANYTKVAADLKRAEQLVAKEEISRQQYDAAVAADQSAQANVQAAEAAIAVTQSHVAQAEAAVRASLTAPQQVAVIKSRAEAALAEVARAQAAVEQAELNLKYTTVVAPFSGVVSKRSIEVGQVLSAGQPMYALIDLENTYITANYKETQLRHMCPGQPVIIHVDTFGRDYRGRVDSLSGATGERFSLLPPENATGNFVKVVQRIPVKIILEPSEDPNHNLRPGMSVEPTVLVGRQSCGQTFVPTPSGRADQGNK